MGLDELNLVGLDKNGLNGHAAVDIWRQVQFYSRGKAVGIFNGEAVVFNEKFNIVVLDGFDDLVAAGDFYRGLLRRKRIQCTVIETDKLDGDVLEFLGLDFLDIDKNFGHGIAWRYKWRQEFCHEFDGVSLAFLDAIDKGGICRNVDDASEGVTGARNQEVLLRELGLLDNDIARGGIKVHVALDGDAAFDSRIDGDIDKEVLVVRFDVVDGGKVWGDEVLGIQVDALGAEFGVVHVHDHGRLFLRLQADKIEGLSFDGHGNHARRFRCNRECFGQLHERKRNFHRQLEVL